MTVPPVLRVAVAVPVHRFFDYLPPADPAAGSLALGARVRVPFGGKTRLGVIVAHLEHGEVPPPRLLPISAALDAAPWLSTEEVAFILWSARYYRYPPGEALLGALPPGLRHPEPSTTFAEETATVWRVADQPAQVPARALRQRAVLERLRAAPAGLSTEQLRAAGVAAATLRALAAKGLIVAVRAAETPPASVTPPPTLNAEQAAAVAAIAGCPSFQCFVLEGVTGSGKTEVYLRLSEQVLARGGQVLVLVPEIGLTPQLYQRFTARLPAPIAVLHSGLTDRERERHWRQAARGAARVLIGTRSAVFTPLPDLALIIVDEEHDPSFKQQDGFRYSARDLAVRRAQTRGCPVVLGSATPALETLRNAQLGRYRRLILAQRAGGAQAPAVRVVDVRGTVLDQGLSPVLLERMRATLVAGEQVLLFLNRRGFAPVLTCQACGWISGCSQCDARLTLHYDRHDLVCHHCGARHPVPLQCPVCASAALRALGQGTERVEQALHRHFPGIPLARIDRDSTRRPGTLARLLAAAQRGEYSILLGTQMLAKGHHLPGVTLVGILDLDAGLYGSDFRATERMAQLLIQVAGRAGRAARPGTVLVQTRHPEHPLLRALLQDGYTAFADRALAERAAAELPPFTQQALLRADSREPGPALAFLRQAAAAAATLSHPEVTLWGPAPAPMPRRAGWHRAQLLVQAPDRLTLGAWLDAWLPVVRALSCPRAVRWNVDIDPQDTL